MLRGSIRTARMGLVLLAAATLITACGSSGGPTRSATTIGTTGSSGASIVLSGGHLVDSSDRTVYMWVADGPSKSTCTGACSSVWPPATASGQPSTGGPGLTASQLSTIKRSDGKTQLVYAGHPLYYYAADSTPGDTSGQGSNSFGAKWWELSATGQPIIAASTAPTTSGSSSAPAGGGGYGY